MSTSQAPTLRSPSNWIVSAWWDLSYIVVTPLLIVPVVLILARRWLTPEEVSLAVIAFASLGHHLPGFMRAYGDRDLFVRYRWRFLFVPVMVFGIALLFTPPKALGSALGLPWTHLHGLELILLVWGTWHGLMQTYGFMRIYDVRMGVNDRWTARLDHWLCLSVFVAGVVFSDARAFGVANAMWQSGLPLFGPEWLEWTRLVVGGVSIGVLVAYLINQVRLYRQGLPLSWVKLLLIGTTGWFYWYTGRLSTNMLIGIAMFEIYHAVQYYAIVWIYNRRLFERAGNRFGPLGFLFQDRWTMLGIYLAAIAAYSSIRWLNVDANAYVYRGDGSAHQWLIALFVTSSFMHFYFDGFIWKVSEKKTQQNLVDQIAHGSISERYVPAFLHAGKWGILLGIIGGLLYAEHFVVGYYIDREPGRLQALAALTPELPEAQSLLARQALQRRRPGEAIQHAEKAVAMRPRSHAMLADLSLAYLQARQYGKSMDAIERAIAIAPDQWAYQTDYGIVLQRTGRTEKAEQAFRRAVELAPELKQPREQLAEFYLKSNRDSEATTQFAEIAKRFPKSLSGELGQVLLLSQQGNYQEAVQLATFLAIDNPNNWRVQLVLGSAYNDSGEADLALGPLKKAKQLRPQSAEVNYQLAFAEVQLGQPERAIEPLQRATEIEPGHFRAQLRLGTTYYMLGKYEDALERFLVCEQLDPQDLELCTNFGGLLAQLGEYERAEKIYRAGLERHRQSGQLTYNLGVMLWQRGRFDEARDLILRAEELGIELSDEVRAAVSQTQGESAAGDPSD